MKRKDEVLLSIYEISRRGQKPVDDIEIKRISRVIGLSSNRIRSYLSELVREGMVDRRGGDILPSEGGVMRSAALSTELDNVWLEPDDNLLPEGIKFGTLKNRFDDRWERLLITSVFVKGKMWEISRVISIIDQGRIFQKKVSFESELIRIEKELPTKPITECLLDSSLIGVGNIVNILTEETSNVLYVANLLRKQGKLTISGNIYSKLIDSEGLSKNQFILCMVGQAQIERALSHEQKALSMVKDLKNENNTRAQNAYLDIVLAEMLMDQDIDSSLPLLRKGIAVFVSMGADSLVALAYIYLGIYYFRVENVDAAMHYLELGNRHAQKGRSDYLQGYALHNLADAMALQGNTQIAHEMLDRSMILLSGLSDSGGDLEGISGVHFNRALVHIEEGRFDEAYQEFDLSMKVAYPLPIPKRREEWKKVFEERMKKKRSQLVQ